MARWADPEAVEKAVREHAEALRRREPSVSRVIWYGSWVNGTPTPSSDVDLCVVVESDPRRPRERVPDYLPTRFPVGVDLLVLTEREFQEMEERAPSWYGAITSGKAV